MADKGGVDELLRLARDKSIEGRKTLVATISDLFGEREGVLTERERALMTDILNKLVNDFEMTIRRELSERLADEPKAPPDLMRILANDAIEVARPVLMRSELLRDAELIEVIRHRTRQHQLAIALRRQVSEAVSDALVETGDEDVIHTLLENSGAHISQATMEYLVDQAQRVDSFQEPLVKRQDLGNHLARRLMWHVSAALRSRILETYDIPETELDDALEDVTANIVRPLTGPRTYGAAGSDSAWRLAERIAQQSEIDPQLMIKVLRRGEIPLFEALFGYFAGLHPPHLQRIIYETNGKGLAIVCRARNVDKASFAPIYLLSRKGRPGEHEVDPAEVSRVMRFFESVNPADARRALQRWQRNPEYLEAIEKIEEARLGT